MKSLFLSLLAAMSITAGCTLPQTNKSTQATFEVEVISAQAFSQRLASEKNFTLLDVRRPEEYAEGHLEKAQLLDWINRESFEAGAKKLDKERPIYLYCRSGRRSNAAAHYLAEQGFRTVDMAGGFIAWSTAGLKVEK